MSHEKHERYLFNSAMTNIDLRAENSRLRAIIEDAATWIDPDVSAPPSMRHFNSRQMADHLRKTIDGQSTPDQRKLGT